MKTKQRKEKSQRKFDYIVFFRKPKEIYIFCAFFDIIFYFEGKVHYVIGLSWGKGGDVVIFH